MSTTNKTRDVEEQCPHCGETVMLYDEFKPQKCPKCGLYMLPCNICEDHSCEKCPINDERNRLQKRDNPNAPVWII